MRISQRAQAVAPFYAMEFGKRAAALEAEGGTSSNSASGNRTSGRRRPCWTRCGTSWAAGR